MWINWVRTPFPDSRHTCVVAVSMTVQDPPCLFLLANGGGEELHVRSFITVWFAYDLPIMVGGGSWSSSKDSLIMEGKLSWFNALVPTLWTGNCWIASIHSCSGPSSAKPLTLLKNHSSLIASFQLPYLANDLLEMPWSDCFSWIQRASCSPNWFSLPLVHLRLVLIEGAY